MYLCLCVCISLAVCVFLCVSLYVCFCICVFGSMFIFMCVCVLVCVSMCIFRRVCVCVCVCLYVCVFLILVFLSCQGPSVSRGYPLGSAFAQEMRTSKPQRPNSVLSAAGLRSLVSVMKLNSHRMCEAAWSVRVWPPPSDCSSKHLSSTFRIDGGSSRSTAQETRTWIFP